MVEGRRYKVLLVEDTMIAQKMGVMMLESVHCDVDVASTGEEAIQQAATNKYDFILMDIGLPDKEGFDVAKLILNEHDKNAVILALTAHMDAEFKKKTYDSGMCDFLLKPLTQEKIEMLIKKHIKK